MNKNLVLQIRLFCLGILIFTFFEYNALINKDRKTELTKVCMKGQVFVFKRQYLSEIAISYLQHASDNDDISIGSKLRARLKGLTLYAYATKLRALLFSYWWENII